MEMNRWEIPEIVNGNMFMENDYYHRNDSFQPSYELLDLLNHLS